MTTIMEIPGFGYDVQRNIAAPKPIRKAPDVVGKVVCKGVWKNGNPCTHAAKAGDFCKRHGDDADKPPPGKTITITFGDQAENHVGMEKIGEEAEEGYSILDLTALYTSLQQQGYDPKWLDLTQYLTEEEKKEVDMAAVLLIPNAVNKILSTYEEDNYDEEETDEEDAADEEKKAEPASEPVFDSSTLFAELEPLDWDRKAWMRGRVVNKHARWNLIFSDFHHDPDYKEKMGRVIDFDSTPQLEHIREALPDLFGEKARRLHGEANYYHNIKTCGIGFHGDTERKIVIALRLGSTMPLHYQWHFKGVATGQTISLDIPDGWMYIMSEKAVGRDWKHRSKNTIRHAAGFKGTKYVK